MSNKYADETFSLETFWRLESIGIRDPSNISDDDIALTNFNDTIQLEGQRYFVTWPWKNDEPNLATNYNLALGRLKSLIARLSKSPEMLKECNRIIKQQLVSNVIEEITEECTSDTPPTLKHYIPHHCVL